MDTATIDQAYGQLQSEFQDVAKSVQELAGKLQAASQAGNPDAKEWLLDLKQIALDVKDEQVQVNELLQAIHGFVASSNQQLQQMPQYQQAPQQQAGGMFGGGGMGRMGGGGGMFSSFLGGGFGRAMEMGAGVGIGDQLINSIFN